MSETLSLYPQWVKDCKVLKNGTHICGQKEEFWWICSEHQTSYRVEDPAQMESLERHIEVVHPDLFVVPDYYEL